MVGREIELLGSGNAELCSDATCGVESSTGGDVDDDARSPGVCKVGLVVSWMIAPGADVCVVGDPSNDKLLGLIETISHNIIIR